MNINYLTISDTNYFPHVATLFYSLNKLGISTLYWGHINDKKIDLKIIKGNSIETLHENVVTYHDTETIVETSTKYRPLLLAEILKKSNCEIGIYIDPDVYVYEKFDEIFQSKASIWISPHLIDNDFSINNLNINGSALAQAKNLLRFGSYNMGIYCVRNNEIGNKFLSTYQEFLNYECLQQSLYSFVDQKWMDFLHSIYYNDINVISDPGINLSYWNLPFRSISEINNQLMVNGIKIKAFHFSGIGSVKINCDYGPSHIVNQMINEYQNNLKRNYTYLASFNLAGNLKKKNKIFLKTVIKKYMFYITEKLN